MEAIIFSYNRPAQLYLLLESMERFTDFHNVLVIYRREDEKYRLGYRTVKERFPKVKFIHQLDNDLKKYTIEAITSPQIAFFCDDDVFIGKISTKDKQFKEFEKDDDILCLSLRLGKNVNYSYDRDCSLRTEEELWYWKGCQYDWGYPMSVSGHVFKTEDIMPLLDSIEFETPTQLESKMSVQPIDKPLMLRYPKQKCIEIPINIVQTECDTNRAGDVSVEWLNKQFIDGKIISLDEVLKNKFNSPHAIIEVKWKKIGE